jgi:hypothetical protein
MKTCSITEAKSNLGRLADAALQGKPTVISRGGKLVILQAYPITDPIRPRPPGYFADCYSDKADIDLENRCGHASD